MNEHILYAFAPQKWVQMPQDVWKNNPRDNGRRYPNAQLYFYASYSISSCITMYVFSQYYMCMIY